ncbi:MAG: YkgJ family cysteine cluster protein [Deltaproteobacteria bacterium]|nr:YkgJ family cysteine cluster protein [Deltaproteobacteria bacterium]
MPRHEPSEEYEPAEPRVVVERRALRELELVYRRVEEILAGFSCPKSGECCLLARTGRVPYLLPLEQLRLSRSLGAQGRGWPEPRADGACAFLDESGLRCSVYADRPFGCRTFFCERGAGRAPANASLHELSARLTAASDKLEAQGAPVPILQLFRAGGRGTS